MQIGGGNLSEKAAAIHHLASINDGLVFVGKMAFPIMKCLGVPLPQHLVELSAVEAALKIVRLACEKKIPILFPKDFYCRNDSHNKTLANIPVQELSEGDSILLLLFFLLLATSALLSILNSWSVYLRQPLPLPQPETGEGYMLKDPIS